MKQSEIIKKMSDRELKQQLIFSQCLFLIIGILLSLFLFDHPSTWLSYFSFQWKPIVLYGGLTAIIVVLIELLLYVLLPSHLFDDGGINKRIFKNQPIRWIAFISIVVALSEELLFRGVIQTTFGFVFASSLFAVVHVRYLKKPVLFILITGISFFIGYLFLLTENLFVTIVFHFLVDFLLGVVIKYTK